MTARLDDKVFAARIEEAFDRLASMSEKERSALAPLVEHGLDILDRGEIRAAAPTTDGWQVQPWVRKLILIAFRTASAQIIEGPPGVPKSFDKLALKFEDWDSAAFARARVRVVPGAIVRRGAFIAPNVVLMPCFLNIGAYVGEGTMIDTWATVGSCAQVGARCHISGGAGIGGVLEPIGDAPVIIEDDVFIGARAEIAEGVRVRRGAVIGMGVYLGRSTPIVDRATGNVGCGEIPEGAVVVSGALADPERPCLSTYAAVIVKRVDSRTRSRTALNPLVREAAR